ncbi:Guanine Nucleotide-Binding Protein G(S) Subunit Alpha Isoforms Xlas [Manis pentadactyla]|nr:Guanine Nucleotide-Binding Protein G(S) Subunit Alpha Isoforms Xlas [Manis pentadactyla]
MRVEASAWCTLKKLGAHLGSFRGAAAAGARLPDPGSHMDARPDLPGWHLAVPGPRTIIKRWWPFINEYAPKLMFACTCAQNLKVVERKVSVFAYR